MAEDKKNKALTLFKKGLANVESGDENRRIKGLKTIQQAADMGLQEAIDWIDDYTYDDNAEVQGNS